MLPRSVFVFGCQDKTDIRMYNAHSSYWLRDSLPNSLLTSNWIQLLDPLLPLLGTGCEETSTYWALCVAQEDYAEQNPVLNAWLFPLLKITVA